MVPTESSDVHILVVSEDPEEDLEIEHPDSCPQSEHQPGVWDFDCDVAMHAQATGLDWWFVHEFGDPVDSPYADRVRVGRHPIEPWMEQVRADTPMGPAEWDGGIRVVSVDSIATG